MAHGSRYHRRPGSMGGASFPSRVFKGKALPGQMGGDRITIQNLEVVKVDAERKMCIRDSSIAVVSIVVAGFFLYKMFRKKIAQPKVPKP